MSDGARAELSALRVGDAPELWEALGFAVHGEDCFLGGVRLQLGVPGRGITGWSLSGIDIALAEIDSLPTELAAPAQPSTPHPNGAVGIDHVVVVTPNFDRTSGALERAGMPLRRVREVPASGRRPAFRQGFRRLGPAILELVETPGAGANGARFWGLVVIVEDLDGLVERLGDRVGSIRDAVQRGRRIATVRESAGLGEAVAFMSPEPA